MKHTSLESKKLKHLDWLLYGVARLSNKSTLHITTNEGLAVVAMNKFIWKCESWHEDTK